MKKIRAITLVELLVAMAVFSIIMAGVMNMVAPVQDTAVKAKILNYQKTNEETVVTYIGEQLRYANNILIAESGAQYTPEESVSPFGKTALGKSKITIDSPQDAINAFLVQGIKTPLGEVIKPQEDKDGQYLHLLIWDGRLGTTDATGAYAIDNTPARYHGRLFSAYDGETHTLGSGVWNLNSENFSSTTYVYPVFGKGYFGTSDIYLNMQIDHTGMLTLTCTSDYYYNAAGKNGSEKRAGWGKFNNSSNNPTLGTFQLRNFKSGNCKFIVKDANKEKGIMSTPTSGNVFYMVYTTDQDVHDMMYAHNGDSTQKSWDYNVYPTGKTKPKPTFEATNTPSTAFTMDAKDFIKSDGYSSGIKPDPNAET